MAPKMNARGLQEQLLTLNKIGIALSKEQDLNQLLTLILTESRQFTSAEAGSLYVREGQQLRFSVSQNTVLEARKRAELKALKKPLEVVPSTFTGFYVSLDKSSLAGYVGVTGKVLNIPDAYKIAPGKEYKFNRSFDEKNAYRTKSMLMVPMKDASGNVVGVIQLINAHKGKNIVPFDKHFENLVLSLASQAAIAIKNTMLTQELKEAYLDTIFRLSVAAEYKDDDTAVHIHRMSRYSAILAEGLGLSFAEVESIRYASPMHDIGKLGVPDSILMKPGKLTPAEFKEMQNHTVFGAKILENAKAELLKVSETIALTHHEKWDGSGYPRGMKGEAIPLSGRIVALADVFDALTTKRCYKPAFSLEESMKIIKEGTGRHFDPQVVLAFNNSIEKILAVKAQFSA
ncbi:MAG TPA: HD domain-containing phosphohydrolase [bacterium]|jgi:putative two-component system response regulator|nr:HD domain-containing phosphohydrolase [bacterium]